MQKDYYEPLGGTATETKTSVADQAGDVAAKAQDKAEEMAGKAQDKAAELGSTAKDKAMEGAEAGRERAATGLQSAASSLRERGESSEGLQAELSTKAADSLDKASTYLSEHDTGEMWEELERLIKEHPMQAAAGALAAGFFLGRILR